MKKAIGNLIGIVLNLLITSDSIVILIILSFPIPEHGISFCLCLLLFLLSMSCSFQSPGLLSPSMCVCLVASVMSDSVTLCTVACQALQSMGFFRQEYWNG